MDNVMKLINIMSEYYRVEIENKLLENILEMEAKLSGCWFADWLSHTLYAINISINNDTIEYKDFEEFEIELNK